MDIDFTFIGNNLAVDLTNTEIISHGELIDLLQDKAALLRWLKTSGLRVESKAITPLVLANVLELRNALKRVYLANVNKISATKKDLATINKYLAHHSTTQVLCCKEGKYTLQPAHKHLSPDRLLGHIADEGVRLLTSAQAQQLKCCQNPECVLIFVDTSRSRKRRWCSMDGCGNRAKVATHYRRTKS